MDLLRAVIVGAYGTPYQDGLFFFDFHLPPEYPDVPPVSLLNVSFHVSFSSCLEGYDLPLNLLLAHDFIFKLIFQMFMLYCSQHIIILVAGG